jgi:uridine phosphorylase
MPVASPPDRALIDPKRGKYERPLPERALFVFTPEDLKDALRSLTFSGAPSRQAAGSRRHRKVFLCRVTEGIFGGVPIAVAGPMLGAPQAVLVLEKLIALGVRRCLALGWCGSLNPTVRIGDVVVPRWAWSEEGTSAHYPLAERPEADPQLVQTVLTGLRGFEGLTVHEGPVWTTDAPYRETEAKVLHYRDKGALGVEMETSALFTVAAYRRIALAVVLVVSDDLSRMEWRHGYRDPRFRAVRASLPERLLQLLTRSFP